MLGRTYLHLSYWLEVGKATVTAMLNVPVKQAKPKLSAEVIVSLTSHPPRFAKLHLTLSSLLRQSVKPDRLVLWLAEGDADTLPKRVLKLQKRGLEIREFRDLRSYLKIVPTLKEFPDAYVVTADDDVFYPREWLRCLVDEAAAYPGEICYHRGHLPKLKQDGRFGPYESWEWDAQTPVVSKHVFPTGVGGIIYPPRSLDPRVLDESTLKRLCPIADDVWLYFMGRLAGATYRKVGGRFKILEWTRSQSVALRYLNWTGANDQQISGMEEEFGILSLAIPRPSMLGASPHQTKSTYGRGLTCASKYQ